MAWVFFLSGDIFFGRMGELAKRRGVKLSPFLLFGKCVTIVKSKNKKSPAITITTGFYLVPPRGFEPRTP
jgi:hypothetical protein